jgi:hypothetical protein
MDCCGNCNIDMETVFTAVLIVEPERRRQQGRRLAENGTNRKEGVKKMIMSMETALKNEGETSIDKENKPSH